MKTPSLEHLGVCMRFCAVCSPRQEQVGQCSKFCKIARLFEGQIIFFPLTLAVSGLERHLAETRSSIETRFQAMCCPRLEQAIASASMPCSYVFYIPRKFNVQRHSIV